MQGLTENIAFTLSVFRNEASLVSPERIVLGGISQGFATAIHAFM